ncbi:unnamed protein product [Plutella xylostella]|uniref:(diamondback moth) hypothetical protein n=1 Tax=Plutella xylostella TaxID=51655 RepID=A0A8S4ELU4_PLUXY|nr:unnamed protein product [Plutella xylostella]
MSCHWMKSSPSLVQGISAINQLQESKFEKFLMRIVAKIKQQDTEVFTEEERNKLEKIFDISEEKLILAIITIVYLFKRMLKYIFMPANLKSDLKEIGLSDDKSDTFIKVWSNETRSTLDELGSENIDKQDDSLQFSSKINAELSSDISKKSKIPKAYLKFSDQNKEIEMELTHSELYSMFLQFESIQHELDNLM